MKMTIKVAAVGGGLLAVFLGGCSSRASAAPKAALERCTAYGMDAIGHHAPLTTPLRCRGLGRKRTDVALSGAGLEGAGSGRPTVTGPRVTGHRLTGHRYVPVEHARLTRAAGQLAGPSAGPALPAQAAPAASGAASAQNRGLAIVTLVSWLVGAASGAVMIGTWIARGGPSQQRAKREGLPPGVIIAHVSLAGTGLLLWISFVVTWLAPLAWTAAGLLVPAVGLGISTVTLWTPFPTRTLPPGTDPDAEQEASHAGSLLASPSEDELSSKITDEMLTSALSDDELFARLTDEVLASALSDPSRAGRKRSTGHLSALIPALHGIAAITTILFALLTVISVR